MSDKVQMPIMTHRAANAIAESNPGTEVYYRLESGTAHRIVWRENHPVYARLTDQDIE